MDTTPGPGPDLRQIASIEKRLFGGATQVLEYRDSRYGRAIHLLHHHNSPRGGLTSFGTIGLSGHDIDVDLDGKPLRIELLGAFPSNLPEFANILSACAFIVQSGRQTLAPGAVVENVIDDYRSDLPMKHLLFMPPVLWRNGQELIEFDTHYVSLLMAVPITNSELAFAQTVASEALQQRLRRARAPITDLYRKSVA